MMDDDVEVTTASDPIESIESDPLNQIMTQPDPIKYLGEVFDWRSRDDDQPKTHLISFRVSEELHRMMSLRIQKLSMVYGTDSDYVRDAVWYFTDFHQRLDAIPNAEIASLLTNAEVAGNAHYTAKIRQDIKRFTDDVQNSLIDVLCDGNLEECHRQVSQFWHAISGQPNAWIQDKFIAATRVNKTIRMAIWVLKKSGYTLDAECAMLYT